MKNKYKILIILGLSCLAFMFIDDVYAQVGLGGTFLTSSNFKVLNAGTQMFAFKDTTLYSDISLVPKYYLMTMCADNENITTWNSFSNLDTVNMYTTNYSCMFPNSSYTGGHIVYVYGKLSPDCSVSGENCFINSYFKFNNPSVSSWALLSEQYSDKEISIDYASQTIISNNQTIINQNSTLIEQNQNLWNKQEEINQSIKDQTDATNKVNDSITDSTVNTDSAGGFFGSFDTEDNGGLSSVITAPLDMVRKATHSCEPLVLTAFDKEILLPCGTTLFWDKQEVQSFRTIWNTVFGGAILFMILRKVFKIIENVKDPQSDKVEVMKL